MTPFRQLIKPGQKGSDVWAVKRAMRRMEVRGAKAIASTTTAGPAFVACVKTVQKSHGLHTDGVYGKATHAIIAPHFDAWGTLLYKSAKLRQPPVPSGAQAAAKRLLELRVQGRYHADNPGDLWDIQQTALGNAVRNRAGQLVHIDTKVFETLVWLIDVKGYRIGTYAICSDHSNDGPHGHAGGFAVDISSINGVSVASGASRALVLRVLNDLHHAPHAVRQLISGGYGYTYDASCRALCIPYASYYGNTTLGEHENHIHAGW